MAGRNARRRLLQFYVCSLMAIYNQQGNVSSTGQTHHRFSKSAVFSSTRSNRLMARLKVQCFCCSIFFNIVQFCRHRPTDIRQKERPCGQGVGQTNSPFRQQKQSIVGLTCIRVYRTSTALVIYHFLQDFSPGLQVHINSAQFIRLEAQFQYFQQILILVVELDLQQVYWQWLQQ